MQKVEAADIVHEQDVDIDCAGRPTLGGPAAKSRFKLAKLIEQKQWCDRGLDQRGRVKKFALIRRPADRLRSVPLAVLHDLHIAHLRNSPAIHEDACRRSVVAAASAPAYIGLAARFSDGCARHW